MFEPNIKCDYDGCSQRYLSDKTGWWIVGTHDENENAVVACPLDSIEYGMIIRQESPDEDKHCCGIEHASIFIKRAMDMINHRRLAQETEQVSDNFDQKTDEDIPF